MLLVIFSFVGEESDMEDESEKAQFESSNSTQTNAETEDLYPCNVCQKRFATNAALNQHWNSQHPDKSKTTCTLCHKTFTSEFYLLEHTRAHLNILPFSCNLCNAFFATNSKMHSHRRKKHPEPFKCDYCEEEFSLARDLYYHKKNHIANHFVCVKCNKPFLDKYYFLQHQRNNTCNKIKTSISVAFSCDYCSKSFTTKPSLMKHKRIYKGNCKVAPRNLFRNESKEIYPCNDCSTLFQDYTDLTRHVIKCNPSQLKSPKCSKCKRSYTRYHNLMLHTRSHLKIYPYSCDICKKGFCIIGDVHYHKKSGKCKDKTKSESFKYKKKPKHFEYKNIENSSPEHNAIDSTHSFDVCNKVFSDGSKTKQHDMCDTKSIQEQNSSYQMQREAKGNTSISSAYSCDYCSKSFNHRNYLVNHKRKYKGNCKVAPRHLFRNKLKEIYPCNDCFAVFNKMEDLSSHVDKCNPNQLKAPKCSKCKKSFTRYITLVQHTRVHLEIYPYSCEICKKGFATNAEVHNHKNRGKCINNSSSNNKKEPKHPKFENKSSGLNATDSTYSCDVCNKVFSDIGDCMKHEKTHSQILKTSRSGRAIKAVVCNTSESREGSSDKENLDSITNLNSDQKCDKKHIENPASNTKLKGPKLTKEEANVVEPQQTNLINSCKICNAEFTETIELLKHKITHITKPTSLISYSTNKSQEEITNVYTGIYSFDFY